MFRIFENSQFQSNNSFQNNEIFSSNMSIHEENNSNAKFSNVLFLNDCEYLGNQKNEKFHGGNDKLYNQKVENKLIKYNKIVADKTRLQVNKVFQIIKSCNGDIKEASKYINDFTYNELEIIYNTKYSRQIHKIFTPEEDEDLFRLISIYGLDFNRISKMFKNKSPCDLKRRYIKVRTLNNILPFHKLYSKKEEDDKENKINISQIYNNTTSDINSEENEKKTSSFIDEKDKEKEILNIAEQFYSKIGREGKKIFSYKENDLFLKEIINSKTDISKFEYQSEVALNILNKILYNKNLKEGSSKSDEKINKMTEENCKESEDKQIYTDAVKVCNNLYPVFLNHKRSFDNEETLFSNELKSNKSRVFLTDFDKIQMLKGEFHENNNEDKENKEEDTFKLIDFKNQVETLNYSINNAYSSLYNKCLTYNDIYSDCVEKISHELIKQKTISTFRTVKDSLEDLNSYYIGEELMASKIFNTNLMSNYEKHTFKPSIIKTINKKCDLVQNLINLLKVQVIWIKKIENCLY